MKCTYSDSPAAASATSANATSHPWRLSCDHSPPSNSTPKGNRARRARDRHRCPRCVAVQRPWVDRRFQRRLWSAVRVVLLSARNGRADIQHVRQGRPWLRGVALGRGVTGSRRAGAPSGTTRFEGKAPPDRPIRSEWRAGMSTPSSCHSGRTRWRPAVVRSLSWIRSPDRRGCAAPPTPLTVPAIRRLARELVTGAAVALFVYHAAWLLRKPKDVRPLRPDSDGSGLRRISSSMTRLDRH